MNAALLILTADAPRWVVGLALAHDALVLWTIPSVLRWRRGRPRAALAWVLALLGLPVLGVLSWWLLGRDRLRAHARHAWARRHGARVDALLGDRPVGPALPHLTIATRGERLGFFPAVDGNRVEVLAEPAAVFEALEEGIRSARSHVHLEFFEWFGDDVGRRLRDACVERARAGVEVRVLLDAVASWRSLCLGTFRPLRRAGGQIAGFMPIVPTTPWLAVNFRLHRKIVVVDGRVAFVCGLNVGDKYLHLYQDAGARLEGPIVHQLQRVFLDDWSFRTREDVVDPRFFPPPERHPDGQVLATIASGPHTPSNASHEAIFLAITTARRRVWLCTPYVIPDPAILVALRTAVLRGVDVRILCQGKPDVRLAHLAAWAYFPVLVDAGVRVFEYHPRYLHAKLLLVDDDLAGLGSANLDPRSLRLSFECGVVGSDPRFVAEVERIFRRDLACAVEVTRERITGRPRVARFVQELAHLASPVL